MAGRSKYTEEDRARVFVLLRANDGNVKRTARESGYPENTVRRWRNEFEKEGAPSSEAVETAAGNFLEDAERVRTLALRQIEKKIKAGDAKVSELNVTVGVLSDKIDRAKGLDVRRVDVQHNLPSAEQARELMRGFMEEAASLSKSRDAEIVEAEIVEQPALPAGQ